VSSAKGCEDDGLLNNGFSRVQFYDFKRLIIASAPGFQLAELSAYTKLPLNYEAAKTFSAFNCRPNPVLGMHKLKNLKAVDTRKMFHIKVRCCEILNSRKVTFVGSVLIFLPVSSAFCFFPFRFITHMA
jgi:hypothetical protein